MELTTKEVISKRFREAMVELNLKNIDIAEKTNYNIQKVSDLKNGKQSITPDIAIDLETYFNINPCWLYFGRGDIKGNSTKNNTHSEDMTISVLKEIIIKIKTNGDEA